jgi:cobyrinic acid a,c-diamide synthase
MTRKNIEMSHSKGIVIAGLAGGSGKSVVAVGLAALWRQAGNIVAPFKKGPDYIDAGWLQCAARRNCYNLDPYLVSEDLITASFEQRSQGADISLVEGNRGLYDGVTPHGGYSTAALSLTLKLPILLVVNCSKTTRTVAAMVLGCMRLDERISIAGVILNNVATERQRRIISEAVEYYCGIPVLGSVPRMKKDIFPMRHLGMIPHQEYSGSEGAVHFLAETMKEHIDIPKVESMMGNVGRSQTFNGIDLLAKPENRSVRIGILQDAAFQFYYSENLAALERCGAELVAVNAIKDECLEEVDGLYIGGGFPETSARELAANEPFRRSIREAAETGMPIYAECGGLIYLGTSIVIDNQEYPLTNVFAVRFGMSSRPQAHGYSVFNVDCSNPFYPVGSTVKGHEFRYSTIIEYQGRSTNLAFEMTRGTGFMNGRDGLTYKNVLALYTHVHAEGTPLWASSLVQKCREFRQAGE